MVEKNELLEKAIKERIEQARYEKSKPEKKRRSIFYLIIVLLVTLSVFFSLLRYVL